MDGWFTQPRFAFSIFQVIRYRFAHWLCVRIIAVQVQICTLDSLCGTLSDMNLGVFELCVYWERKKTCLVWSVLMCRRLKVWHLRVYCEISRDEMLLLTRQVRERIMLQVWGWIWTRPATKGSFHYWYCNVCFFFWQTVQNPKGIQLTVI